MNISYEIEVSVNGEVTDIMPRSLIHGRIPAMFSSITQCTDRARKLAAEDTNRTVRVLASSERFTDRVVWES